MPHLACIKLPFPVRLAISSTFAKSALTVLSLLILAPLAAHAQGKERLHRWTHGGQYGFLFLRGLVADSASAVMGTLRYSWLATAFCVVFIVFYLLLCVFGDVLVDLAHTSGLKTKRRRCWRVMRLPRVPLVRGQCPRGSRQRCAERLPNSRAEGWRLRAKAGCSPGMRFRSAVRLIGRPQRPRLRPRFHEPASWSYFDVRRDGAFRGLMLCST